LLTGLYASATVLLDTTGVHIAEGLMCVVANDDVVLALTASTNPPSFAQRTTPTTTSDLLKD